MKSRNAQADTSSILCASHSLNALQVVRYSRSTELEIYSLRSIEPAMSKAIIAFGSKQGKVSFKVAICLCCFKSKGGNYGLEKTYFGRNLVRHGNQHVRPGRGR